MSSWRKRAIECAPELRKELEDPGLTVYGAFFELLPLLRQAHMDNDVERLKKIYAFAAWCFNQKNKELWNAAGVAFYEHLGDHQETLAAFTQWIPKSIFAEVRGLLENRIPAEELKRLITYYGCD